MGYLYFAAVNFLAHIYLSGENDFVRLGNFMADSIRGKKYRKYPLEIQKGILLHRQIDTFTDAHSIFKSSTKRLHKNYSHYSGVIVDIYYDHFLAANWSNYSDIKLADYTQRFYELARSHFKLLPRAVQYMLPYMISGDWLYSYATLEGIEKVLAGMNRRTNNKSGMNRAINDLKLHYKDFEQEFAAFFEELITFSATSLQEIEHNLNTDKKDNC